MIPDIHFYSALQTAIGPVILISGVGLLLLTMTNRLGRAVDRARALSTHDSGSSRLHHQLDILVHRARVLRTAILLATSSALSAAVLIILLFLSLLLRRDLAWLISSVFIVSMLSLIASLVLFMIDVNESLTALSAQLTKHKEKES